VVAQAEGHRHVSRVYGPDLMLATCQAGLGRGYCHFLYGGAEGVAAALAEALRARFPGCRSSVRICRLFGI